MRIFFASFLFSSMALGSFAGVAQADEEPRVAVMPFEGRRGPAMTRAFHASAPKTVRVVALRRSARVGRRLGITLGETGEIGRAAKTLAAQFVVVGLAQNTGSRLQVVVFDARGREVARGSIAIQGNLREAMRSLASRTLGNLARAGSAKAVDEEVGSGPQDESPALQTPERPDAPRPPVADPTTPPRPPARFEWGLGLRSRDLGVQVEDGRTIRHFIPAYPEAQLLLELRPFAHAASAGPGGFFIRLGAAYAMGFGAQSPSGNDEFFGLAWAGTGDLGWLFAVGSAFELGASVGGSFEHFWLESNAFIPSARYALGRALFDARMTFFEELLHLRLKVGYERAFHAGPLEGRFGQRFRGNAIVVGASSGITYPLSDTLAGTAELAFDWRRMNLRFAGSHTGLAGVSGVEQHARIQLRAGFTTR